MTEIDSMEALAAAINEEHRRCEDALSTALEHAIKAGELLLKAKEACEHGTWLAWLEENFEGSTRTAQVYKYLAERAPRRDRGGKCAGRCAFHAGGCTAMGP